MRAFVTGISGQCGSYLAEILLEEGYEVHGLVRPSSNLEFVSSLNITLHEGDIVDGERLLQTCSEIHPDEIYNLAGVSDTETSFDFPEKTGNVNGLSAVRLLEYIKRFRPECRYCQSCSSEMFDDSLCLQNESTPLKPKSPYATAKTYAYWTTINYRDIYGIHASNAITFNHESPRRSKKFVSKKIIQALIRIKNGHHEPLMLGNIDHKRDWGYAPDYVKAMWMMLQKDWPDDYVLATGKLYSIRQFCDYSARILDIDIKWIKEGRIDYGVSGGRKIIIANSDAYRPVDTVGTKGDSTKAAKILRWKSSVDFEELIKILISGEENSV